MLDKVVLLDPEAAYVGVKAAAGAATDPGLVEVLIKATAPQVQCRLTLWNAGGRSPKACDLKGRDLPGGPPKKHEFRWTSKEKASELDGKTLTWQARFFADVDCDFEMTLEVWQGGAKRSGAEFLYTGPLAASEIEERSGLLHLSTEKGPGA